MSKREKLRRKLRNNPKGRTKHDIETLLGHFGFVLDRVSGSHHIFIFVDGDVVVRIVIPIHVQQVKSVYVKQVLEKIDEVFPPDEETSNGDDVSEEPDDE